MAIPKLALKMSIQTFKVISFFQKEDVSQLPKCYSNHTPIKVSLSLMELFSYGIDPFGINWLKKPILASRILWLKPDLIMGRSNILSLNLWKKIRYGIEIAL